MTTAIPDAAAVPAMPTNIGAPILVENVEAPTWVKNEEGTGNINLRREDIGSLHKLPSLCNYEFFKYIASLDKVDLLRILRITNIQGIDLPAKK